MELQVSRNSKFFCLVMALLMSLGMFISAGTSVNASETNGIDEDNSSLNLSDNYVFSDADLERLDYLNSLSPKQLLQEMRNAGIDVESIYSESEIKQYESQTRVKRAGTTKLVTINANTKDLYLNSMLAAMVKVGGVGAVIALVPGLSTIARFILRGYISKSLDTSRGIIIRFNKHDGAQAGMNGYYWAISSVRRQ
jgi:hypothetical protein